MYTFLEYGLAEISEEISRPELSTYKSVADIVDGSLTSTYFCKDCGEQIGFYIIHKSRSMNLLNLINYEVEKLPVGLR